MIRKNTPQGAAVVCASLGIDLLIDPGDDN